jgi:hypothetical protein
MSQSQLTRQAAECLKIEFSIFRRKIELKHIFKFKILFLEKINIFNENFLYLDSQRAAESAETMTSQRPADCVKISKMSIN